MDDDGESTLMMETQTVSEMLDSNSILTQLIASEDCIAFSHCKSFKYYPVANRANEMCKPKPSLKGINS
jgi:hypothetical protein